MSSCVDSFTLGKKRTETFFESPSRSSVASSSNAFRDVRRERADGHSTVAFINESRNRVQVVGNRS